MAKNCDYTIGGKTYSEKEFKQFLLDGGLQTFLSGGDVNLSDEVSQLFTNQIKQNEKATEEGKASSETTQEREESSEAAEITEQGGEADQGQPPLPPKEKATKEEFENKPKSILNRIYASKNVSQSFKDKFKDNPKGLRYDPQSHEVARQLAKEIVDEFGTADAVSMAESGRFDGDVNSMIFAEAIDRTFTEEQNATTQEEKIKAAEQWADYATRYDETARQKGKFISAVYDFYKKSPLGVSIAERAKRDEAFKDWFKKREGGYKEVFEAIKEEPEFKAFVEEKVKEGIQSERKETRESRRKKINDIFDKGKIKGDQLSSSIIPPQIWNAAVEVMKQAALAGESIISIIEKGVDYIKTNHKDAWDETAFREEWKERLSGIDGKRIPTDEETIEKNKERVLNRFRKRLSGLNDAQKEEVIRKSFKKLVDNGALEYDEFKKIIADVLGLGELTAEEITKLNGFIQDINAVQDAADNVMNQTEDSKIKDAIKNFDEVSKKAERSATKLAGMLYNKPNLGQLSRSMVQLNTLGIVSLIKNPFYNIFHQLLVRLPKGIFLTAIDGAIWGASLLGNKLFGNPIIKPDTNILLAQKGYFNKGGEGSGQAIKQVFTGLTNKDYFQKEVYNSQIKPFSSAKDLWASAKGDKPLTTEQIFAKLLQASPIGISAELVARGLNIGDKPFRYAAEGAIADTLAIQEFGLKGIERERFIRFPKEVAKRIYKARGLSEEDATKRAEAIENRIVTEGEEAVFQQKNVISEVVNAIKNQLSSNNDGTGSPLKNLGNNAAKLFGLLNMPFVKTPVNIAWEVFNLVNPEFALLQSAAYGVRAFKNGSREDALKAKKWAAHAATGWALLAATAYLASIGAVSGDDEDEPFKEKEAKGKGTYEKPYRLNLSKTYRALFGEDLDTQDGDLQVDLSWFGATGMVMNMQANKYENMTKEERDNMTYVDNLFARMRAGATEGLVNSVFQGTLTAVDAIRTGRTDQWMMGMMNVGMNFIEPATLAQISRATRPYEYTLKAETFPEKLQNNLRARFFGKVQPKNNIWGEPMKREGTFSDVTLRMLGVSKYDSDQFAQPIFKDFKKTGNASFFPPVPARSITVDGQKKGLDVQQYYQFEQLIGKARQSLVAPFINNQATIDGKTYKQMDDDAKLDALEKLYKQGYDIGKKEFQALNPEFQKKQK